MKFVLLGYLLRHGLGAVVEFGEGVLFRHLVGDALALEIGVEIASERLGLGDEDASFRYGVASHVVVVAVAVGIVVVVESVGSQHLDDGLVFHLRLGNVVEVDARRVALILHVESELLLLHLRCEVIHVLHHQVPVALLRVVAGVLERLDEESLSGVGDVGCELAHLIGNTAVGVLVGHSQHLVGLQSAPQRHVAEGSVHRIFRRGEQPGALQLLEVVAALQSCSFEHGGGLVDVACCGILVHHGVVLAVGSVGGHGRSCSRPHGVAYLRGLAQVGEGYDVSGVGGGGSLVGYPNLHSVDGDASGEVGQFLHPCVVVVAEVSREEEVSVLLIVGHIDLEGCELHASLRRHALRRRFLLRQDGLQLQFAKLHIGAHTEEAAGTADERRVGGERHVACLHELDDLVFLAVVLQLHVLRVVVEGGVGVVVEVHVHLVAHLSVDVEVDLLIKLHHRGLAVADGQRGVVHTLLVDAKLQLGSSLRAHSDASGTEDFLGRSQVEVHVGEVKFLLSLGLVYLVVLLAVVGTSLVELAPCHVLGRRHHDGSREPCAAQLVADDVAVQRVVVLHVVFHVVGALQV